MSRYHQASGWNNKTKEARKRLAPRPNQPCGICGFPILIDQAWHLDHIRPLSQGGSATASSNIRVVHAKCNLKRRTTPKPKGPSTPPTFSRPAW